MIKITKDLIFTGTDGTPHNFIGCQAEIISMTPSYCEIQFYSGLPFLIKEKDFLESSTMLKDEPMNYHEVYDIHVIQNDKKTSAFRTIFFEDDDLDVEAEKKALSLLKLVKGVHYDSLSLELISKEGTKINNQIKITEMATKKTTEETTEEKGLSVFEKEAERISLPAVPEIMKIGNLEFSEEKIKKQVEDVKKIKIEIPLPTDVKEELDRKTKIYEDLKAKKQLFVKTRTVPETFRKELIKPFNDWTSKIKKQTDKYGDEAKKGEEYCVSQLAIYENYLEEQERAEQEKKDKLVKERSQQLSDRQGVKNYDSGHWTFPYAPNLLIEQDTIETEDGWVEVLAEIDAEFEAYGTKQKEEQEKLAEGNKALVGARVMLLEVMSYKSFGDSFIKNGHVIKNDAIGNYSDEDWKALIASHNVAVQSAPEKLENIPVAGPFETASSPQAGFGFGQPQQQTQPVTQNPFSNPFEMKSGIPNGTVFQEGMDEITDVEFEPNSIEFTEENPFYENDLKVSTLRVYHSAYREQALNIPNRDEATKFAGKLTDNLEFIIYKK